MFENFVNAILSQVEAATTEVKQTLQISASQHEEQTETGDRATAVDVLLIVFLFNFILAVGYYFRNC